VFNSDNNNNTCFLSSKSAGFLKDHVTLKNGVMAPKNSARSLAFKRILD